MYKLVLVLGVVAFSAAKLPYNSGTKTRYVPKDTIWVLDINDDDFNCTKLRSANKEERREFKIVVEPSIIFNKMQPKSEKREEMKAEQTKISQAGSPTALSRDLDDSSEQSSAEIEDVTDYSEEMTKYDVKKGIKMMINKFILSYQGEPNLHVHLGDHDKVSVKLYFKGVYSALVVRYKNKRWNYFLKPPSSLPRWFYEKHTNVTRLGGTMYVDIPDTIRNDLYGKFFSMLKAFISFIL